MPVDTQVSPTPALRRMLWDLAAHTPDTPALRDAAGTVSRVDLARLADATAGWLSERGVRHGDRVLVRASAGRATVAVLFGCLRIGAVFVPYSTDMTRYQLTELIEDAEPALLLTDDARQLDWATVRGATTDGLPAAPDRATAVPESVVAPDDLALLLYTSGSTAKPKAVACTHAQVSFAAKAVASMVRYRRDDVVFCRLPLSFDYGLYQIFLTFMAGGTLVLSDASRDSRLLADVAAHEVTVLPVVPSLATMLLTLATRRRGRPESLRVRLFTNTGEHLSLTAAQALRSAFPGAGVQMMFGTTECKRISVLEVDGDRERPGSIGRALPGTSVQILGEDGRELPPGQTGEISVRGPHLMEGYWRAPELTAERYRVDAVGDRYLLTGDFGHLDADGYLYFEGRRDHLFKIRGTRTSTVEIEAAALTVPEVTQAAVLPPTPQREAVLCVVASATPEDVLTALRDLLGPAKTPARCRLFDAMPLTANGKVDRRSLSQFVDGAQQHEQ